MIEYKDGYAIVDGYKFRKDKKTGYYLSNVINGKRYRLHRYIYQKYYGEIPKGYDIHHIDHNKDNNEIENLQLLERNKHKQRHAKEITEEQREFYRNNINEKARPKAIEWHKSPEGREWHKKQYEVSLGLYKGQHAIKITMKCLYCGKEYETIKTGSNKFCSNNCKSAYRRKLGIDNETRKCNKCNKEYIVNKYSFRKYCYECQPLKNRSYNDNKMSRK